MSRHQHSGGRGSKSIRLQRVNENLRHALSEILREEEIRDEDLMGVSITVTAVDASPDLRNARIFVEPLGGLNEEGVLKALNRHSAFIRGCLARKVAMKYLPRLVFAADSSFAEADRIEALLRSDRVRRDLDQ